MAFTRSDAKKLFVRHEKLEENKLPFNVNVINHYYYLRKRYSESKPGFSDLRNEVINDLIHVWQKANLPILSYTRIQTKLKEVVTKFKAA